MIKMRSIDHIAAGIGGIKNRIAVETVFISWV